jgi:hypothetical protein
MLFVAPRRLAVTRHRGANSRKEELDLAPWGPYAEGGLEGRSITPLLLPSPEGDGHRCDYFGVRALGVLSRHGVEP